MRFKPLTNAPPEINANNQFRCENELGIQSFS